MIQTGKKIWRLRFRDPLTYAESLKMDGEKSLILVKKRFQLAVLRDNI